MAALHLVKTVGLLVAVLSAPHVLAAQAVSLTTISTGSDHTRSLFRSTTGVVSGFGMEFLVQGYVPYFYSWSLSGGYVKSYVAVPPGAILTQSAREARGSDDGMWGVVNFSDAATGQNLVVRYNALSPTTPEILGNGLAFSIDNNGLVAGVSPTGLPGFYDVGAAGWTDVPVGGLQTSGTFTSAVSHGGISYMAGVSFPPTAGSKSFFMVNGVQESLAGWNLPMGTNFEIQSVSSNAQYVGLSIDGLLWVVDRSAGKATQLLDATGSGVWGYIRDVSDYGTVVGDDHNTFQAFGWSSGFTAAPFRSFVMAAYGGFDIGFDPQYVDSVYDNGTIAQFGIVGSFHLLEGPSLALTPDDPIVTPEPATVVLLGSGLLGVAGAAWRRRQQARLARESKSRRGTGQAAARGDAAGGG